MRRLLIALLVVGSVAYLAAGCSSSSRNSAPATSTGRTPDAVVEFSEGSVAAGIGFSWGSGTLTYKNQQYPIKAEGLAVGEVGIQRASARGNVYDLKRLEDFSGNYTAAGAGAAVVTKGPVGCSAHLRKLAHIPRRETCDPVPTTR